VGRYFADAPWRVLWAAVAVVAVLAGWWAAAAWRDLRFGVSREVDTWMSDVLGKLAFSQNPFLPSYWVAGGVAGLSRGETDKAWYYFQLVLSNALMLLLVSMTTARRLYLTAYQRCQAIGRRRRRYGDNAFDRLLGRLLVGIPGPVRLMVIKDVKGFRRDVVQWSQVSIFFGLLAVYMLNIRRFHYDQLQDMKHLVSFLNLAATALTLSTFTTRFIFPLLSLEGRNFWVLALLPLERRSVLHGKFLFAFGGSLILSETLIVLSDLMLRMEWRIVVLHAFIVLIVCGGLSGLAVGLGAMFPNLREENPSKIVSGFGGTLNLMASMFFLVAVIALFAVPTHLAVRSGSTAAWLGPYLAFATVVAAAFGAAVTFIPLWMGGRAFERLEA
jgi:ABC-2 type transport system permease protein